MVGCAGHRRKTARGAHAPEDRHRRRRGGDEDPCEVPARAGERGVRAAARARRSSRRSCAPTRSTSGWTRSCWSRSTASSTSRAARRSARSTRPAAAARRAGRRWRLAARRPADRPARARRGLRLRRRCCCSAVILVLGFTGEEDEPQDAGNETTEQASDADREREDEARERAAGAARGARAAGAQASARRTVVRLRLVPAEPTYACVVDGSGKQLFGGNLSRARDDAREADPDQPRPDVGARDRER